MPKTRTDFWQNKFDRNVENDRIHKEQLEELGWNVITIWECEINSRFDDVIEGIVNELQNTQISI